MSGVAGARYRRGVRAAQIVELGSPPRGVELDDVAGIRIEAVALNPLDISVGSGVFYGGHPPLPYAPGCEAVGRRGGRGPCVPVWRRLRGREGGLPCRARRRPRGAVAPASRGRRSAARRGSRDRGCGRLGAGGLEGGGRFGRPCACAGRSRRGRPGGDAGRGAAGAEIVVGAGREARDGIVALDDVAEAFGGEGFTVCIDPIWGEPLAMCSRPPHRTRGSSTLASRRARRRRCAPPTCVARSSCSWATRTSP